MVDADGAGAIVMGPVGIGRTRVLDEVAVRLRAQGIVVRRASGSATTAGLPLGALAHLLPVDLLPGAGSGDLGTGPFDTSRVLAEVRRALTSGDAEARSALVVDDAHLLDAVSLTVVSHLVDEGRVAVLASARTGDPMPDALRSLWRDERLVRIDLPPLDDATVEALIELGVGGQVEGRARRTLVEAAHGSPLLARDLLRSAIAEGVLAPIEGVWHLRGELPAAHRAAELVADRVAALEPAEVATLELLVLVGPVEADVLDELVAVEALDAMEREGLLATRLASPEGPLLVEVADVVIAGAVRAGITSLRARSIRHAHADRVEARSDGSAASLLRVLGWRLDAGEQIEPELALAAARLARHAEDFVVARRLAQLAHDASPSVASAILLADASYETGAWPEVEAVLTAIDDADPPLPTTPAERLRLVGQRGTNLLFGLLDPERARAVTAAAEPDLRGPGLDALRAELVTRQALLQVYDGDPAAALELLDRVPAADRLTADVDAAPSDPDVARTQVLWATPGVPALALGGRTIEAIELAQLAYVRHGELAADVALTSRETHLLTLSVALQEHGAFDEAEHLATAGYHACVEGSALTGQTWFALNLARLALLRGRAAEGRRWCAEALSLAVAGDWRGPQIMALSGSAALAALAGDLDDADRATAAATAVPGRFGFLAPERCLGPAWVLAERGRRVDAIDHLVEGADLAARTGHRTVEAWLLHEAARLGAAPEVLGRLEEVATRCDGPLVAARLAHVRALADGPTGSVAPLVAVADAFAGLGCERLAADALHEAAERSRRGGDDRRANALRRRWQEAVEAVPDRLPGAADPSVLAALTRREGEIAALAAAGATSQEIAERLYLSIRTVSNHLAKVYRKLGISGRSELAAALGL